MRINPAGRVGMPPLRAARVKHEIVEIPKGKVVIALRQAGIAFADRVGLGNHVAIGQQGEKLHPRKTVPLL